MPPLLVAHQLHKYYVAGMGRCWARVHVLAALSFTLHRGERVVITGTPGSGKTTLLHCLTGLRRVDAGSITWEGAGQVAFHLCTEPVHLADGAAAVALVDLPPDRCSAVPWLDALHRAAGRGRGWLVFGRDARRLAPLATRALVLRDGVLHEPPRRGLLVAEPELVAAAAFGRPP